MSPGHLKEETMSQRQGKVTLEKDDWRSEQFFLKCRLLPKPWLLGNLSFKTEGFFNYRSLDTDSGVTGKTFWSRGLGRI